MHARAQAVCRPGDGVFATPLSETAKWFWPNSCMAVSSPICHSEDERRRVVGILKKKHTWLISVEASMRAGDTEGIIEGCKALQQNQMTPVSQNGLRSLGSSSWGRQVINWGEAQEMSAAGSHLLHSGRTGSWTRLMQQSWRKRSAVHGDAQREAHYDGPVFATRMATGSAEVERLVEAAGYAAATSAEFGMRSVPLSRFGLNVSIFTMM